MAVTPLFRKLNLKAETRIVVLDAPASFEPELAALEGVAVLRAIPADEGVSFALAFVQAQAGLDAAARSLAARAVGDALLWFAYPKQTSRRYRCDFNRDTGFQVLRDSGYESVRMVAIDEDWSALRFRRAAFVKARAR